MLYADTTAVKGIIPERSLINLEHLHILNRPERIFLLYRDLNYSSWKLLFFPIFGRLYYRRWRIIRIRRWWQHPYINVKRTLADILLIGVFV
ncbi:hypothetical protein D3C74_408010 [compost metagenome]